MEIVIVVSIGILLISIPSVPNTVYIMQGEKEFEKTVLPTSILMLAVVGSMILTLSFQIFVYFGLTKQSKNLISFGCLAILLLEFICALPFIVFKIDFKYFIYVSYVIYFLKNIFVPLEILYRHDEARYHLRINHHKLFSFPQKVKNHWQSFKNVCCYVAIISNEIAPLPIPIEFRIVQGLRNVNLV